MLLGISGLPWRRGDTGVDESTTSPYLRGWRPGSPPFLLSSEKVARKGPRCRLGAADGPRVHAPGHRFGIASRAAEFWPQPRLARNTKQPRCQRGRRGEIGGPNSVGNTKGYADRVPAMDASENAHLSVDAHGWSVHGARVRARLAGLATA
jgi:hypothetical protein